MKDKKIIILVISLIILIIHLVLPLLEFRIDNKLIYFSYDESFGEFEYNMCYSEGVSYNEKRNISINDWDVKKVPFGLYMFTLGYEEGNLCDYEYVLEEAYINDFIENAIIEYNTLNIDLASLIEGREVIVGNTRYLGNDYEKAIYYILDGKHEVLYIFYVDDLLVIQVGNSDEGPRFIAYK